MKPTKEQIDAARAQVQYMVDYEAHGEWPTKAMRVLLAATEPVAPEVDQIPREKIDLASMWQAFDKAKTAASNENPRYTERAKDLAGLDAVRGLVAEQNAALTAELEAERKAHAEIVARWQSATNCATPTAAAMLHDAWQSATGHASPEAYAAARVEPGADVIEKLARIYGHAYRAQAGMVDREFDPNDLTLAGIRAVVAALAEMGVAALPSENDIIDAWDEAAQVRHDAGDENAFDQDPGEDARTVRSLLLSRLAPVLGARRVLDTAPPTDEELAEEAAAFVLDRDTPKDESTLLIALYERIRAIRPNINTRGAKDLAYYAACYVKGCRREGRR